MTVSASHLLGTICIPDCAVRASSVGDFSPSLSLLPVWLATTLRRSYPCTPDMYLGKPRCARRTLLLVHTLLHRLASCAIAVSWQVLTRIHSTSWRAYTRGHAPAAGALDLHAHGASATTFPATGKLIDSTAQVRLPAVELRARIQAQPAHARARVSPNHGGTEPRAQSQAPPTLITPIDDGSNIHAVNCGPLRAGKDVAAGSSRSPQPISNWPRPLPRGYGGARLAHVGAILHRTAI